MVAVLKNTIQALSRSRLFDIGVSFLERRRTDDDVLRVLMYHRVDHAGRRPYLWPGMIGPTPEEFSRQIDVLTSTYRVVSMADLLAAVRGESKLPPKAVLITFDDAYRDFAEHAWPVLRQHRAPVTVFVATDYAGDPQTCFWWDRLYHSLCVAPSGTCCRFPNGIVTLGNSGERMAQFKRLREYLKSIPHADAQQLVEQIVSDTSVGSGPENGVLSWDDLLQLHKQGVTLAPHTRSHPMLNRMPVPLVREEISRSWGDLVEHFGPVVPKVLAYPAGGVNDDVVRITQELGFELAFGTKRGLNRLPTMDRFRVRRINVGARTTIGLLRAQLAISAD